MKKKGNEPVNIKRKKVRKSEERYEQENEIET